MTPESGTRSLADAALSRAVTATLLVLSTGEEIAKRIENHLRNAGHPVRCAWATDLEDLEDLLRRAPPDMVLSSDGMVTAPARDVLALCSRFAPDVPVLRLVDRPFTVMDTVASLKAGGRSLVSCCDPQFLLHLELICLRELRSYTQRRELRDTRLRLADYEARYQKLMAGTGDAVVQVQEGIITHANAAFAALLGQADAATFEGNPLMDYVAGSGQAQAKQFLKLFSQGKLKSDKPLELVLRGQDGKDLKITAQVAAGDDGADHAERRLELLIRSEAPVLAPASAASVQDAGRAELFQTIESAIKTNVGMHRALLVLMVDSFASIEQRLGYHDSEEVLSQLSALVKQRLGQKETLFRFSTAMLALVISRPSPSDLERLAETLRSDIAAQLFKTDKFEAHLAAAVVCYPIGPSDQAVEVVDSAVREVRKLSREGGNRVAVVGKTAEAAQVDAEGQRKADQVKKALQENRMKLAYQSIASLEGDDRQHFDVLARLLDESGHEVPAREFIPAAEKFGLIVAVDRWVIARALGVLAKRQGAQDQSSLFVRISEQTLKEGDAFYKWFTEQLKSRPLRKEELVIAIQESIVETHVGKAKAMGKALKDLGADLALDYFGVGNNSAQMLEHVPASFVRFHYSFSKDFNNPALQKKLGELITIAKQKSVRTIMGQVEDANAMARLWQLGVNYIQGFHVQAPEAVLLSTDLRR